MKRLAALLLCFASFTAIAQTTPARQWTRITGTKDSNTYEVSLTRTADGVLHVAWLRPVGAKTEIMHTAISADGKVTGEPSGVVTGWQSVSVPAIVVERDGSLRVLFGGVLGTSDGKDPYNAGSLYTATAPADGSNWKLLRGKQSDAENVYLGPIPAVISGNGSVVTAWAASSVLQTQVGLGLNSPRNKIQDSCCPYQPGLGVDGSTGEVAVAWYSNDTPHLGLNAQVVAPSLKQPLRVPGSVTQYATGPNSLSIEQEIAISGRLGAPGIYVAFPSGYPTFRAVNLWKLGDATPTVLAKVANGRTAFVTAGPKGRLWVMWSDSGRFYAERSNRAASRFSAPIIVTAPAGIESTYRMKGEGSAGPLDMFAHVATSGTVSTWHTRVYPKLEVSTSPKTITAVQGGAVTIMVTDVGDPVANAIVKIGSSTLTTDESGKANYEVPKGSKPGLITFTVTAEGYEPAKSSISIR